MKNARQLLTTRAESRMLRRLRSEVDVLTRDTVTPALADVFERAAIVSRYATERVRAHSDTVASHVRGRPLIAVVAGVGFCRGRMTR